MERSALKQLLETFLAIEGGIEQVKEKDLKKLLSTITDLELLVQFWKKTSANSQSEKLIEARMMKVLKEVLPTTTDLGQLVQFWENTPLDSKPQQLIEARMKKVLKDCHNLEQMMDYCDRLFYSYQKFGEGPKPTKLIEARIKVILDSINDLDQLIQYRGRTSVGSNLDDFIQARLKRLLKNILPTITNLIKLIYYWRAVRINSQLVELIEDRMVELIKGIPLAEPPDWFGEILTSPSKIPEGVKWAIASKAREILAQL